MKLANINRNRYVSANGHSTKNAFDMFPRTDIAFDVLPILSCHVETVCLLSQLKQKPDDYINVTIELDDVDIISAETKATYDEIKKPIGILQGKSLPRILRQNKYVTKRKNS